MGIIDEFKTFIRRGNVMDLAVGVIMGAAFGTIISSLVGDMLMPAIGLILQTDDLKQLQVTLAPAKLAPDGTPVRPPNVLAYGKFLKAVIDFLLIAFCVFLLVKIINRVQGPRQEAPKPPPEEVQLLTEIRDLLKGPPGPAVGVSNNPSAALPNVAPPGGAR
jgi:large conductance mechanosensitive channel